MLTKSHDYTVFLKNLSIRKGKIFKKQALSKKKKKHAS